MAEYKFQLIISPESYDYGEEDIVYRIFFDQQLISERSFPVLKQNQGIVDTFILELEKSDEIKPIFFVNLKTKKAIIKKFKVNDFLFDEDILTSYKDNIFKIQTQGLHIKIFPHK